MTTAKSDLQVEAEINNSLEDIRKYIIGLKTDLRNKILQSSTSKSKVFSDFPEKSTPNMHIISGAV